MDLLIDSKNEADLWAKPQKAQQHIFSSEITAWDGKAESLGLVQTNQLSSLLPRGSLL
jgi:hypothetical protein